VKISTATVPASCVTPSPLSMVVALAVSIDNTVMVSPGERGALASSARVVVVVVAPGVVVIGRVMCVVVIGRVANVVIGGIVIVVIRRIVAVTSSSTKEKSRVFVLC